MLVVRKSKQMAIDDTLEPMPSPIYFEGEDLLLFLPNLGEEEDSDLGGFAFEIEPHAPWFQWPCLAMATSGNRAVITK